MSGENNATAEAYGYAVRQLQSTGLTNCFDNESFNEEMTADKAHEHTEMNVLDPR